MTPAATAYRNLLEPPRLVELFLQFPPKDFACGRDSAGAPVFHTRFDLLTTLEKDLRARLEKFPLRPLSRRLRFATCFAGTTVTEYAPLPADRLAESLLDDLLHEHGNTQSLLICKDLPDASPLLPEEDNAFAARFAEKAGQRGFIEVQGQALAYVPIDFSNLDEYLSRLSGARRKDLRRKMKTRVSVTVERLPFGDARFHDQVLLDEFYAMYLEVFAQSEIHFDLLSPEFFAALLQSRDISGVVLCYRHQNELAGYNICLLHNNMLVDKYIGFKYPLARELNLYFISWLVNLEFALENGLSAYIAGWTDPEVKAGLGARFTFTRHLVWVRNPLLRRILFPLRRFFESDKQAVGEKA